MNVFATPLCAAVGAGKARGAVITMPDDPTVVLVSDGAEGMAKIADVPLVTIEVGLKLPEDETAMLVDVVEAGIVN